MVSSDDVKYAADMAMIARGFHPVKDKDAINMDAIILTYKCDNAKCKNPYEVVAITGLEAMQNSAFTGIMLIEGRCEEKVANHKCT